MCDAEATSDEHTPPKCLFPTRKDTLDGKDYRVNLITVPSCDKHNSSKSHHDEYLLLALAGSYTSSHLGLTQFITKVNRAFEKAPSKASNFVRRSEHILLKRNAEDEWEEGAQIVVEGERLDLVLENCARALYFHETGKRFNGTAHVITVFTMYLDPQFQADINVRVKVTTAYFERHERKGKNQEVFWYKFEEGEKSAIFLMHFYSTSGVIVRLMKQ
jgi:hypothetical protein